jgi:hypothetical protein
MAYSPTIITDASPALQINTAGGVTYLELLQALGGYYFSVRKLHIASAFLNQLFEIIQYNHYSSDGNTVSKSLVPNVDPYQKSPAIIMDLEQDGVILDGRSSLAFNIQPNENILLTLETDEVALSDLLNMIGESNVKTVFNATK